MSDKVFVDYSRYYDLLYQDKDYVGESKYIVNLLKRHGIVKGSLLEFGSGTGKHGRLIANEGFQVHGIERSAEMVKLAEQISLLDNLSKGRLIVGIGRGSAFNYFEYRGFGVDPEEAQDRLLELENNLVGIWNGDIKEFDGTIWNSLGASLNEEIALMCLSFIEMLRNNIIDDESQINFTISLDTDFFLNIAKIRSLRIIINNLYDHFGINPIFKINGRTSDKIIFKESPWVNQLRITNAALSAAIANIDRLTCHHITNPLGQAPEFVRRLTRNTHIILQEESNIGKIQDAAGGSYYIESITKSIADKSFDFIKYVEKNGGILSLLENREFINKLSENKTNKDKMLEEKNIKRIGVNLYPDKEIREINIKPYEKNNSYDK